MTAKQYLSQPDHYETLIHAKIAEYLRYQTLSMNISAFMGLPLGTVVQTSGHSDKVSQFATAMADAKTEAVELMDEYARLMVTIDEQLKGLIIYSDDGAVINDDHYKILHLRFLERVPLTEIPEQMHCSESSMYRIWGAALNAFENKYLR